MIINQSFFCVHIHLDSHSKKKNNKIKLTLEMMDLSPWNAIKKENYDDWKENLLKMGNKNNKNHGATFSLHF